MKLNNILLIALITVLASCGEHCERGVGQRETRTYTLSEFDGIDIGTWGDVEIIQSNEHKVELHTQSNIIDRFRINVHNGTLFVGADCFNSNLKPLIYVYCKDVSLVRLAGSGKITSKSEFNSENLRVELSGSGDINLTGKADHLDIKVSGSGDINLFDLPVKECEVKISGSGDCDVNVQEHLRVQISGSGRVSYIGNPEIDKEISGSGRVINKN